MRIGVVPPGTTPVRRAWIFAPIARRPRAALGSDSVRLNLHP